MLLLEIIYVGPYIMKDVNVKLIFTTTQLENSDYLLHRFKISS